MQTQTTSVLCPCLPSSFLAHHSRALPWSSSLTELLLVSAASQVLSGCVPFLSLVHCPCPQPWRSFTWPTLIHPKNLFPHFFFREALWGLPALGSRPLSAADIPPSLTLLDGCSERSEYFITCLLLIALPPQRREQLWMSSWTESTFFAL